uniref:Tafazzin family protein n=1 Tax=Steinernema glaseri TaxID=37863 RepID=A0A1I8AAT6_9BILA
MTTPSSPPDRFNFPWPFPKKESLLYRLKSNIAMCTVQLLSKTLFAANVNKMVIRNKDVLVKHIANTSRPLLTISNHRCNIDDPLLWSTLTWREFFANISRYRYTLAAHNICFTKAWHTTLFSLGRCVPIVRGAGVKQEGMDFCIEKLDERKWVHVFPEARLAMEAKLPPIVLPIWVTGMDTVWPNEKPYYPRFGHSVEVTVGEPLDMQKILPTLRTSTEIDRRKELADIIQGKLFSLGEAVGVRSQN